MGIFDDIVKIVAGTIVGGPAGAIAVFTVEHGSKVLEGTVDVARQIVKVEEDIYRAIPSWAIALGGDPIHGLLKHVAEDELIMLGKIAGEVVILTKIYWPVLGPVGATEQIIKGIVPTFITIGSLVGKIHHRRLNDQEWEMTQYIFRDSLFDRNEIILTNFGSNSNGRPFVYPTTMGDIYVNLGRYYTHDRTIPNGPLLFHELTHVWQAKRRVLTERFLSEASQREYNFQPGKQWHDYKLEQQASIVEAWCQGAIERHGKPVLDKLAMNSPLFRYINGNIRRANNGARTSSGHSVRKLLAEGGHRTVKEMHPPPPKIWWEKKGNNLSLEPILNMMMR